MIAASSVAPSGRYDYLKEIAYTYSFVLSQVGVTQ